MNPETARLAQDCLTHIESEMKLVDDIGKMVGEFRGSLKNRDRSPEELLQYVSALGAHIDSLHAARETLRHRLAGVLGLPAQLATIGKLADQCPPELRGTLHAERARLRESTTLLNGQLASLGNLIMQLMEITENVFRSLAGQAAMGTVYERDGRPKLPFRSVG